MNDPRLQGLWVVVFYIIFVIGVALLCRLGVILGEML